MRPIVIALLFLSSCATTAPQTNPGFEIQLNEAKPNHSSKANIEIRIIDSNGKPVKDVKISLLDSQIQTETNQLGIATINIADPLFKDRLKILSATIPIDLRGTDRVIAIVVD